MFVDRSRETLINSIIFFASNTAYCGKEKLFKLLYLLDFEHFSTTGQSVTNLAYRACESGPVPADLDREWNAPKQDFAAKLMIRKLSDSMRDLVVAESAFDDGEFSELQVRLLQEIAGRYAAASAEAIDVRDAANGAWARVWSGGRGQGQLIPYEYAIREDAPHRDAILHAAREYQSMLRRHDDSRQHPR